MLVLGVVLQALNHLAAPVMALLAQRDLAVASNAPFSEWGATFTDPRLAAAVLDRLTFKAHIIETGSDSYRLRSTRAAKKGAARAH